MYTLHIVETKTQTSNVTQYSLSATELSKEHTTPKPQGNYIKTYTFI